MFYSLTGNIIHTDENAVAIDVGGVGYLCYTTLSTLKRLNKNEKATLFTHLNVREDAMDLFAFYDKKELDCFKMLISVSGVGPKAALAILSQLSPESLAVCVATGDAKSITRAQGVGPKLAQRVVLELKDKIKIDLENTTSDTDGMNVKDAVENENTYEAISALIMLGYSRSEAAAAVAKLDSSLSIQELIKQALKQLSRQ